MTYPKNIDLVVFQIWTDIQLNWLPFQYTCALKGDYEIQCIFAVLFRALESGVENRSRGVGGYQEESEL